MSVKIPGLMTLVSDTLVPEESHGLPLDLRRGADDPASGPHRYRCYALSHDLSQFRHCRPIPVGDPGLWYCAFGSSKVSPAKGTTDGGP